MKKVSVCTNIAGDILGVFYDPNDYGASAAKDSFILSHAVRPTFHPSKDLTDWTVLVDGFKVGTIHIRPILQYSTPL